MRGVTSTEIKNRPDHAVQWSRLRVGALGKGEVGYLKWSTSRGGITAAEVNLISLDDSYAPPKTVEQTRRLVESDGSRPDFSSIGTAHNTGNSPNTCRASTSRNCSSAPAPRNLRDSRNTRRRHWGQGPFRYEARLYARYARPKSECQFAVIFAERRFRPRLLLGLKDVLGENTIRRHRRDLRNPGYDHRPQIVKLKHPAPTCW